MSYSLPMTDGAMTPLSTLRAGATSFLELVPDVTSRRGPSGYMLLNVGGWLGPSSFGRALLFRRRR